MRVHNAPRIHAASMAAAIIGVRIMYFVKYETAPALRLCDWPRSSEVNCAADRWEFWRFNPNILTIFNIDIENGWQYTTFHLDLLDAEIIFPNHLIK